MHYPEAPSISVIYGYINVVLPKPKGPEKRERWIGSQAFGFSRSQKPARRSESQVPGLVRHMEVKCTGIAAKRAQTILPFQFTICATGYYNKESRHTPPHTPRIHRSPENDRRMFPAATDADTYRRSSSLEARRPLRSIQELCTSRIVKNLVRRSGSDVPGVTNLGRSCCPVAQEMISTYCMSPQQFVFGDSFLVPKDFSTADVRYTRTYQSGSPLSC